MHGMTSFPCKCKLWVHVMGQRFFLCMHVDIELIFFFLKMQVVGTCYVITFLLNANCECML